MGLLGSGLVIGGAISVAILMGDGMGDGKKAIPGIVAAFFFVMLGVGLVVVSTFPNGICH
ncbi:MAG TPA: hypothetical protein VNG90_03730 [Candidatus Acidoferrum sp.]|nr:hypothetical protein [Candidatus Acidoferrum sp.]